VHSSKASRHKEIKNSKANLRGVAIVSGSFVPFLCCSICFEISIIHLLSYWFSPWGFFQGHVDQKHLCKIVMVCLFTFSIVGVKDPRGYFLF
jgi:hypothetical protein